MNGISLVLLKRGWLMKRRNYSSQDAQIKRPREQSNLLWGNYRQDSLKTPVNVGLSLGSGIQSTPTVTQDAAKESRDTTAKKSISRLSFTLKSDTGVVNDSKFSHQSQSVPEPCLNTASSPVTSIFQKKANGFPQSSNKDIESFSLEASTRTSQVGEAVRWKIGSGQQALGFVLGSFGQSRNFGAGLSGSVASPSPFSSGFATASSGGSGFANLIQEVVALVI